MTRLMVAVVMNGDTDGAPDDDTDDDDDEN